MRRIFLIPALSMALAASVSGQQKRSSDPYAPPPPPPKAPSMQPDKGCSGQATSGDKGKWKTSSTCPPPVSSDNPPPIQTVPDASTPATKHSTADDNPFPEDVSRKAAEAEKAKEAEDAKQPDTSAAAPKQGESSSRDSVDKNLDLLGDRESRISDGAGGVIHDPKLAVQDVHVGQFYLNREDYKGAYARFKEATLVDPENPDAIFYLAEAARHMNHRDEALQNYQLYLDALPDGSKAKEAKKALRELNGSAKR